MQLEQLFHHLLGLGSGWKVAGLDLEQDTRTVKIRIEEVPALWSEYSCPEDGGKCRPYGHGDERKWRHLNIFEFRCEILCRLPRSKCEVCGQVRTVPAPWEGKIKGFTVAFEAMCLMLLRAMSVNECARFVGEQDTRLWRMLKGYVQQANTTRKMSEVRSVSCDELAIAKGHQYATVFADSDRREVLFATEGKDETTWARFAKDLADHEGDAKAIEWASMDMSGAYKSGARQHCPTAIKVFDKFHVIKLVGDAVDQVRRKEIKQHEWLAEELKGSRYIWLKNPENLTEKQSKRKEKISQINLATTKAYQMRLALQDIYNFSDAILAQRRLKAWARWTRMAAKADSALSPMARAGRTILANLDGILSHWCHRLTNAFMEGLMSVFSATKRKARGYRTFENLRTMLYFVGANLDLPAHPVCNGK